MKNVAVVGSQWGDEGKGKIVDWLSYKADAVVRFQGGHNAGHTLVVEGQTYKLSLLPSGVIRGKKSFIGNGVVLDLKALQNEIKTLEEKNIKIDNSILAISQSAPLIMSYHQELDKARESELNGIKIGTTGRGIGPAYEDHVGRRALRVCDLFNKKKLSDKIENALSHHNPIRKGLGIEELNKNTIISEIDSYSDFIKPFVKNVWDELFKLQKENKNILFEGAQGALLDIDHGTYPFVTSSNTVASAAATGSGCGPNSINYVLGITKAYTTRVGEGPFPTELKDKIGEKLGTIGKEFGTVTSRKRRCGWFDGVLVRQTIKIAGIDGIALTKLDVLDNFTEIKMCVAYEVNGKTIDYLPASVDEQRKVKPIYKSFKGWNCSTKGIKNFNELPDNAKNYVKELEKFIETKISSISTSPERNDTILIVDPFSI